MTATLPRSTAPLSRSTATLALGVALFVALLASLMWVPSAAHAGPGTARTIDPAAVTALEIHKFEQPDQLGEHASGLPQDTTGLTPVPGATFTAKLVPGIDLATNAGQEAAASLTADDARALVSTLPIAASGTTDTLGNATLAPLGVGLYYVEETAVPSGFVGSAPFLVALPLTDPVQLDRWLTTVHVYPKNARVGITLEVDDANAVALGQTVGWRSRSGIPALAGLDGYRVDQRIPPELELGGGATGLRVSLDCPGCSPLIEGTHFTRGYNSASRTATVDFTPAGLLLLSATAQSHPGTRVAVDFETTVQAEGDLRVESVLYPSRAAIDGGPGAPQPPTASARTKWGPLGILVNERGNPAHLIQGARFRLFLTAEDAIAGVNPIEVSGVSEWTTDADGRITVSGLRFSDFVNGLDRAPEDPLFRDYFVIMTYVPAGYEGVKTPLALAVTSTVDAQVALVEVWRTSVPPEDLAVTGARITGVATIVLLLLGAGAVLLVRRRRSGQEPAGS